MKTATSEQVPRALGPATFSPRLGGFTAMVTLLLATMNLAAMPAVDTLTGGPSQFYPQTSYGNVDGNTATEAKFRTPFGIALDAASANLFVADRDNNAVRQLDLAGNQTYTFVPNAFVPADLIAQPVGVALDSAGDVYVLNRGNGDNGTVLQFDTFGDLVKTNATDLINAAGIALDGTGNIYLTVQDNTLIRIAPNGTRTTITTNFPENTSLQGIVFKHNGLIAACDSGRHGIYLINPTNGVVTTNAGFHGQGDFTSANNAASSSTARFNQPYGITEAGDGTLVVADYGNHRVKVVLTTGVVTNLYGVSSTFWYGPSNPSQGIFPGWWDGTVTVPDLVGGVEARQPVGVAFAPDGTVYTTETYYHVIRKVTGTSLPPPPQPPPPAPTIWTVTTNYGQVSLAWTTATGATNYNVKRSPSSGGPYTIIASTAATSYTDTNVINGTTYFYVVSASNAGGEGPNSAEVSATPPWPPVPDPQIGYVDFPSTASPIYSSVFHQVSAYDFYNDATIIIKGTPGSGTYYTDDGSTPTPDSASVLSDYEDGLYNVMSYTIPQVAPILIIKAMAAQTNRPNSAVVTATFQFKTGNPVINGNNAAQFTISDITAGAHLYYTLDGSDPSSTNGNAVDLGTVATPTNVWTVGFPILTNTLFKVRAFRDNYQPSAVVSTTFSATNFNANKVSFGFAAGEASSDFIASPGQLFYAPVTLSVLPDQQMYSLQFNITVTNLDAAPSLNPVEGYLHFESMLEKPDPNNPGLFLRIPPAMFFGQIIGRVLLTNLDGTISSFPYYVPQQTNPPPTGQIINPWYYNFTMPFLDLRFVNPANNLIGVGWLERQGKTNLFNTLVQDLIKYSQPHDTLFDEKNGKVVLGGYAFRVPTNASAGDQYRIEIGRPSATSDGIGAPGSDVYIATPTNGLIKAIQTVTAGQRKYVVGDVAPFRWFNAGDFGNTNGPAVLNDDVMQVFQSVIYGLNYPPPGSDFEDGMDSCCGTIVPVGGTDFFVKATDTDTNLLNDLFKGDDTLINSIGFGDGKLDVTDVYVTFRRAIDPSLLWFQRFWTNGNGGTLGVRAAQFATNQFRVAATKTALISSSAGKDGMQKQSVLVEPPAVVFVAGDATGVAGQTLQIPITARIRGSYPIRVLALNLTVQPLDGSPALTQAIQFMPAPALGQPTMSASKHGGNYTAAWLNSGITGLAGSNVVVGLLTFTVPASAPGNAAYAIHFDHASASPNGIAPFAKRTQTGLITLADRSASSWSDGIPDSWRLRYFGSINNILSAASGDADGDGATNLQEHNAGTDPNDSSSHFKLSNSKSGTAPECVVRWPSVANKRYVIEIAPTLYGPNWTPVSTNTGTGWDMEYHDAGASGARFYRVRLQQ